MAIFELSLIFSTLLCSLVAGFLFSYAIVIMPGIKSFDDRQFVLTFQVTDRIIQNNHPLFLFVWIGSVIALIICAIYGLGKLQGPDFFLLILATLGYIFGVQGLTLAIHLPMNNKLQKIDIDTMSEVELNSERIEFESRWNRSNTIRTIIACTVSLLLIVLVLRL